ncbi:MAG: heavy metal-binding domain-containing protein [Defluviitaleaceae bacterium]|nr:heavy metal-binding domain-containing protein [Defluviitaleaceae bacterium]
MLLVTTPTIPNKEFEVLGLVQGNVVRAKHIGRDIAAGFKNIVGGEIRGYTELMNDARKVATERMINAAAALNADAIVAVRYETCSIMASCSEVMAYGTAVKFI